ncbi:uncharacterized protein LOC131987763 [Centropristis striata]|uniref:uncharacterized protein LOC131987763 n=1 Tax=Centropristis striata TaxID=184440 RepID=UPI0027E04F5A|nr:uncharacterized protein LOC131987763 [Centropristis striata]
MDPSEMTHTIVVTPESVLPIVNRYFERISETQWSLLAAETLDSGTQAILSDMMAEIVQSVSAAILKMILSMFQDNTSPNDILTYLENVQPLLGDSLSDSFASALQVTQEQCESAEELTEMVESEVAAKVNSALSVVSNTSVWPSKPAIFVSGSFSNTASLHDMVIHAVKCLKRLLGKVSSQCLGLFRREKVSEYFLERSSESPIPMLVIAEAERCDSAQSVKSRISVPSATQAVTDILLRWSGKTPEMEQEEENVSASLDAHFAAADIVRTINKDLYYTDDGPSPCGSEKSTSMKPHFNMGLIINKVKDFFQSSEVEISQKVKSSSFLKFAQQQFEKMKTELRATFTEEDQYSLVTLQSYPGSPRPRSTQDAGIDQTCDESLPGVPQSPRCQSDPETYKRPLRTVTKQQSSEMDFETIKGDVDCLFNNLIQQENSSAGDRKTVGIASSEVRKFSKELTDKMYEQMMIGLRYRIPSVQTGRCLSDSVISVVRRKVDYSGYNYSPDILYAITEDTVGKYLQQVLLWLVKLSEEACHSDQVSGAVNDINDLVTRMMTPTPEENQSKEEASPEAICGQTTTPLGSSEAKRPELSSQRSLGLAKQTKDTRVNPKSPHSQKLGWFGARSQRFRRHVDSRVLILRKMKSKNTSSTARNCITALLDRILMKAPWKSRTSVAMADIKTVVKRLSEQLENLPCYVKLTQEDLEEFNRAVMKDLENEFGSQGEILKAATASDDRSFDEAVLSSLEIRLNSLQGPDPESICSQTTTPLGSSRTNSIKSSSQRSSGSAQQRGPQENCKSPRSQKSTSRRSESHRSQHVRSHVDSQVLTSCKEKCSPASHRSPAASCASKMTHSGKSDEVLLSTNTSSESRCFLTALLTRILMKAPWKSRTSVAMTEIQMVVKRLSEKVEEEEDMPRCSVRTTPEDLKQFSKAVIKDLENEFGSQEEILKAATALDDTSFDEVVLSSLKIRLISLQSPAPKSRVARFFSAVGKNVAKPFRWFKSCSCIA